MTPAESQAVHDALAAVLSEFCEMERSDMFSIYIKRHKLGSDPRSKRVDVEAAALAEIMEGYGLRFSEWKEQHDKN